MTYSKKELKRRSKTMAITNAKKFNRTCISCKCKFEGTFKTKYCSYDCRENYYRLAKYGLTEKQYKTLVKKQKGKCAICKRNKKLCIDHNHETGKVRGLLCTRCNLMLQFFDNEKWYNSIKEYVSKERI